MMCEDVATIRILAVDNIGVVHQDTNTTRYFYGGNYV